MKIWAIILITTMAMSAQAAQPQRQQRIKKAYVMDRITRIQELANGIDNPYLRDAIQAQANALEQVIVTGEMVTIIDDNDDITIAIDRGSN